jgi:peptidoglycan/xylan/chitin deacetylase (PgdA/CDA1 family)
VIGYHRVVEDFALSAESYIPSMLISIRMLEQHIDWLARHYRLLSLSEITPHFDGLVAGGKPPAALTFDDGYRDFYELAFPLLRRKGIPAALFVVTDLVDTSRVHLHDALYLLLKRRPANSPLPAAIGGYRMPDVAGRPPFEATRLLIESLPLSVLSRLVEIMNMEDPVAGEALHASRSVTWEMIEEMKRAGITIGSHTKTHVLLPNESAQVVTQETAGSRTTLSERLGGEVDHFAYPSGAWDDASLQSLKTAGYRFGFTTCAHRSPDLPSLTIPRTLLWERSCLGRDGNFSGAVMSCLIEGAFDFVGGCRNSHRRALSDNATPREAVA